MKHSIWSTAEDLVSENYYWVVEGPWLDAEYEDTLELALEHIQLCCEAILDSEGRAGLLEDYDWLDCKDDVGLLETLLDNIDADHRWYNDIRELLFMRTLQGA